MTRTQRFKQRTQRRRVRLCGPSWLCEDRLCVLVTMSVRNGRHLPRLERLEELPRALDVELRIDRLDAEEEPVAARQREAWNVEHRVIRLRQSVEREHAEHRRQGRDENRALERHRDERGPAVKRVAADVE